MPIHLQCDTPQTLHAVTRLTTTATQYVVARGGDRERADVAARVVARLEAAGFGLSHLPDGRVHVTAGTVDVATPWRRARPATRERALAEHRHQERGRARDTAILERLREAAERRRRDADRAEEDADLATLVL